MRPLTRAPRATVILVWKMRPSTSACASIETVGAKTRPFMRLLFGSCFTLLIAAAIGLGATWLTLTRGIAFGALTIGAWTAWPKSGSADIDPYARATIARTGELPTGMGDGIAFYAHTDDRGHAFDGRCTFSISGMTPPARYWTVTLYTPEGRLVANAIDRHGFTSEEIARDNDGRFTIAVAPLARS